MNEGFLGVPCSRRGLKLEWDEALPLAAGLVSALGRCFLRGPAHKRMSTPAGLDSNVLFLRFTGHLWTDQDHGVHPASSRSETWMLVQARLLSFYNTQPSSAGRRHLEPPWLSGHPSGSSPVSLRYHIGLSGIPEAMCSLRTDPGAEASL